VETQYLDVLAGEAGPKLEIGRPGASRVEDAPAEAVTTVVKHVIFMGLWARRFLIIRFSAMLNAHSFTFLDRKVLALGGLPDPTGAHSFGLLSFFPFLLKCAHSVHEMSGHGAEQLSVNVLHSLDPLQW
jgi:hypothetical protein